MKKERRTMNKEKNQRFFYPSIFPKSRRGDIPTLILVIGVFLVCAIAIFSFAFFNNSSSEKFNVLTYMATANSLREKIRFYENTGANPIDYLHVKAENGVYIITAEMKRGQTRQFYVEYRVPIKAKPTQ